MKRKIAITIGIASIISIATIIVAAVFIITNKSGFSNTLIFGTPEGPWDLDPHYAWDSASLDVIDQIAEGLFRCEHSLSPLENNIVPNLATGYTKNGREYSFSLVQNASFHDGRKFNATWVKASFDRLSYLMNISGNLPENIDKTMVAELYEFYDPNLDQTYPIINKTEIINEFTINFTLNIDYAPFISLLCFSASYIFIPLNGETKQELWDFDDTGMVNWTDYLSTSKDHFFGTGPWIYDHYRDGVEVVFTAHPNYWRGASRITKLVFSIINDANNRNNALLVGDIHFLENPLASLYEKFNTNSNILLKKVGQGMISQYLGMNNKLYNITWRQVISHVIDYDYIINWWNGTVVRMESPIPIGIYYANWTSQEAKLNITKARMLMQSMGFGYDEYDTPWNVEDDFNWTQAARDNPFRCLNFTIQCSFFGWWCPFRNQFQRVLFMMLINNLELIGVEINIEYVYYPFDRDEYSLIWLSWGPDYNEPSNFINPLFTNRSIASNGVQYDGFLAAQEAAVAFNSGAAYASTWVSWSGPYAQVAATPRDPYNLWDNTQLLMEAALSESNPATREAMYSRIQMLLVEQDMPWVYAYVNIHNIAHIKDLKGYPYNTMGRLYFYPCYFLDLKN